MNTTKDSTDTMPAHHEPKKGQNSDVKQTIKLSVSLDGILILIIVILLLTDKITVNF